MPGRGRAVPYGVYDIVTNTGWVSVGVDQDTASFAVETIRRWWYSMGSQVHPRARRLLITERMTAVGFQQGGHSQSGEPKRRICLGMSQDLNYPWLETHRELVLP
jgi:Rhodopirellula transposase DDE domain